MKLEYGVCYTFFSAMGNPIHHRIVAHSIEEMQEWKNKIADVGYMFEGLYTREANKYNNLNEGWKFIAY